MTELLLTCHCQKWNNSKISLCCILCSSSKYYWIYQLCIFILHYIYIQYIHFCYFITKWPKGGTNKKKHKRTFFCFIECKYAAYLLKQPSQLINGRNVCGADFCEGAIHKIYTLKFSQFFWFLINFYALWEKDGATKTIDYAFGQTSSPSLFFLATYVLYW